MVSGDGRPPGGFRWVDTAEQDQVAEKQTRRWWLVLAALVVVVVLVGAGLWGWRSGLTGGHRTGAAAPPWTPPIGTPKDLLVSFSLDRQPVAGWQIGPADVG